MPEPIHVLILEDRRDDAEIMVLELEADGYEVRWVRVETPEAFLDQLEFNPDIILADYTLPRFTAPDALALLQKTGRDIPFIVVTGIFLWLTIWGLVCLFEARAKGENLLSFA